MALHNNLMLMKFDNGFRMYKNNDADNKHWVLDEIALEVGDTFKVGPSGYFEFQGNEEKISTLRLAEILKEEKLLKEAQT
jgi:hypothetical protein|tara:strand:- start:159 stop:398 length:240 start_codon:yes stop_codon:yes gene_type:complete